jgi:hypothetical protein
MSGVERMMCKWIGKFIFSGLWTERPYLTLVLIFLLFVGLDILRRGRQNPPSSTLSIFACLSTIFVAVFVSGPTVVKAMENPPGPGPSEAGPSSDRGEPSSAPLPGATPDFARQFQEAQDKRMLRREADELAQFLSNIQDTESETKKLEYQILFHQEFIYRCRSLLDGRKLPMLEEENARLVNPQVEELKLRNLLQALLAKEKEAYNLSNLWLLEKRLNKPEWVKSVLIPFLLEFGKKGGPRARPRC